MNRPHIWTPDDDELLVELHLEKTKPADYTEWFPGVSQQQIYVRRQQLGLVSSHKRWTKEADDLLKKHYPFKTVSWQELFPGRTKKSIYLRAKILGINTHQIRHRWTIADDMFIQENYPVYGKTWGGWKQQFGEMKWATIQQRASRLKVKRVVVKTFTSADRAKLVEVTERLAAVFKVSPAKVIKEIVHLYKTGVYKSYKPTVDPITRTVLL